MNNDLFHTLRTVSIMELGAIPYSTYLKNHPEESQIPVTIDKAVVIIANDDYGIDNGDVESIQKMHQLLLQPNEYYYVVQWNKNNDTYYYLTVTSDPEYLIEIINLAHVQASLDKQLYAFEKKYGFQKKRKH